MKNTTVIHAAIAGIFALGPGGNAAAAEDHSKDEKCAGVIKAGRNDCATSTNACHGHVTTDAHPEAWIWVPKGTCARIVGARVTTIKSPDEV